MTTRMENCNDWPGKRCLLVLISDDDDASILTSFSAKKS